MRNLLLLIFGLSLLVPGRPVQAEVDATPLRTLELDGKPLDSALSPDGRIFVLVEGGKIQIFSPAGSLEDTLDLGGPAEGIDLSAKGNLLYVRSAEAKSVTVVSRFMAS